MVGQQAIAIGKKINTQGFSLIELIFALSIFSIGILAVSTLAISSINGTASARRVTEATTLAEDRLERLMALPYDNIESGQTTDGGYNVSWTVVENDLVANTKSVTVTVTRPGGLRQTNVSIRHLIPPNG